MVNQLQALAIGLQSVYEAQEKASLADQDKNEMLFLMYAGQVQAMAELLQRLQVTDDLQYNKMVQDIEELTRKHMESQEHP